MPVVEVHLDPAQLDELRDLPEDDGGDRPLRVGEQLPLVSGQFSAQGVDEDMGVEVQHSASQRIPVDMISPRISSLSRRLPIRLAESRS